MNDDVRAEAKAAKAVEDQAAPFPLISIRDVPEIQKQLWLVEGIIPRFEADGTAGYVFGPPKARKSLFLADVGLSVTSDTPALGHFKVNQTGTAVGFFAEDPKPETSRRVHRMARARGIEVPHNLFLIDVPSLDLGDVRHQERLLATLEGIPDLAFAWFDPMIRLHRINDNRAEELGPIHTFLRTCARSKPGAVFAFAHHTNKEGDSRGSTDYGAFGDFNLFAAAPDAYTTRVARIENRGGPPGQPFAFTVEDGHTYDGATMRLVVSPLKGDEDLQQRDQAVRAAVAAFKLANPELPARVALPQLRKTGLRIQDTLFYELWRTAPTPLPRAETGASQRSASAAAGGSRISYENGSASALPQHFEVALLPALPGVVTPETEAAAPGSPVAGQPSDAKAAAGSKPNGKHGGNA